MARNKTMPGICGCQTYVCYPKQGVNGSCTEPNKPGVCRRFPNKSPPLQ